MFGIETEFPAGVVHFSYKDAVQGIQEAPGDEEGNRLRRVLVWWQPQSDHLSHPSHPVMQQP